MNGWNQINYTKNYTKKTLPLSLMTLLMNHLYNGI